MQAARGPPTNLPSRLLLVIAVACGLQFPASAARLQPGEVRVWEVQELTLASQDLEPRSIPKVLADGLDGWSFLIRTPGGDFALAYFENSAPAPRLRGFKPGANYQWTGSDPRSGQWSPPLRVRADGSGVIASPAFPEGGKQASRDVAAKLLEIR